MPMSASLASPGPLTTQPITATFRLLLLFSSKFSISLAIFIMSILVLPQVGHEIKVIPHLRSSRALSILNPALTSSTGSSVRVTLMVSPMPSSSKEPIPIADFMVPIVLVPASVTPRWRGY